MFLQIVEWLAGQFMDQTDAAVPPEQLCPRASQQRNAGRLSAADKATVDRKADAVLGKKGK